MSYLVQTSVDKCDLNPSVRNISALCGLYGSVVCGLTNLTYSLLICICQTWFTQELDALKPAPEGILSPTAAFSNLDPVPPFSSQALSSPLPFVQDIVEDGRLSLPLSHEMALWVTPSRVTSLLIA